MLTRNDMSLKLKGKVGYMLHIYAAYSIIYLLETWETNGEQGKERKGQLERTEMRMVR